MFEKIKNMLKVETNRLEYVVNTEIFEEYLKKELQFSLEENLEACVDLKIFYKGESML